MPPTLYAQPPSAEPGEEWQYVIRPGDTLISLGRAYLRDPDQWRTIARLNRVSDPTRLRVGDTLRVPLRLMKAFGGNAEVIWARGDVRVFSPSGGERIVSPGERLAIGDRIETGADSALRIRLVDGALLLIGEGSRVTLDDLTVYAHPTVTRTKIGVDDGRVESAVAPARDPSSRYEIRTPVVTTAVRGTDFRVGLAEGRARAEVLAGRVDVSAGAAPVGLDAGFGLVAAPGEPLAPPRAIPPPPDLSSLPARLERLPVRIGWPPLPESARYRVQLFSTPGSGAQLADLVVDAPDARWPDLADGAYRLVVRGIDAAGLEGRDAGATLVVDARPEPPFANAPANASRVYGERTEFRWTKSQSAASYDLQVSTDASFTAPIVSVQARAATSESHALPPGSYYWRVASRSASGERGPFGDAVSFTQRRYPEGRQATAGVDRSALTLRWSAGPPGESSQFQLAADAEFARVLIDRTLTESEVTVPRPEAGVYYLRVRAIDGDGVAGPYGVMQQIEVPALPKQRRWWWVVAPAAAAGVVLVLM